MELPVFFKKKPEPIWAKKSRHNRYNMATRQEPPAVTELELTGSAVMLVSPNRSGVLSADDIENLRGVLVATNACSFGEVEAPRPAPFGEDVCPYGDVWYAPIDVDNFEASYAELCERGMSALRVHLLLASHERQLQLYATYPRIELYSTEKNEDCYDDHGLREITDVCTQTCGVACRFTGSGKIKSAIFLPDPDDM